MDRQPDKLDSLIKGHKQFQAQHATQKALYEKLIQEGQHPKALMIACSDSRVDPAIVTQCGPGELFMVRNVANLVPPCDKDPRHHGTSAAIEYAVLHLGIEHIIIMGHKYCGGIRALMAHDDSVKSNSFIDAWMRIASPAKQRVLATHAEATLDEQAHVCEKASLQVSLDNLMTFPWVAERVVQHQLFLHAWYFDLAEGQIEYFDPASQDFKPLT